MPDVKEKEKKKIKVKEEGVFSFHGKDLIVSGFRLTSLV